MEGQMKGQKDRQILFYKTFPVTAGGPKRYIYVYTMKSLLILRGAKNQKYAEKVRSWRS